MKNYRIAIEINKLVKSADFEALKNLMKQADLMAKHENGNIVFYNEIGEKIKEFPDEMIAGDVDQWIRRFQFKQNKKESVLETLPNTNIKKDITNLVYPNIPVKK